MGSLSAVRRTGRKYEQSAQRTGSKEEQKTLRTKGFITDGFLKHPFLPLYRQEGVQPDKEQSEKGFFNSLSTLCGCYGLQPMDVSGKPYPYNILLSYWDASQRLRNLNTDIELTIVTDENEAVMLSTRETAYSGSTLFYIPVLPLYRLLQDRRQRKCAELLLSVFAYLYQVACVPYYRDDDSYLCYHYEVLEESADEDTDNACSPQYRSEFKTASRYGDIMQRRIYSTYHLNHFGERIDNFMPKDTFGRDCLKTAKAAFKLWRQYPDHTIYQHIHGSDVQDEEADEEQEECIRINEYISFIAENKGSLYDNISEMVNSEFNERAFVQEPAVTRVYDGLQSNDGNLDFERQLFAMITDLCTLLNDLP